MGLFRPGKPGARKKKDRRRRHPRINATLVIHYQVTNETQLRADCRSKNISEGGICFRLYQQLETGDMLKLWIHFRDFIDPLLVIGKVVWTKHTHGEEYPFEAGIEFTLFDSLLRSKIQDYIQSITIEKI